MEFRHLATDADATASSEDRSELPNRVNDPMTRLIENDRVRRGGDACTETLVSWRTDRREKGAHTVREMTPDIPPERNFIKIESNNSGDHDDSYMLFYHSKELSTEIHC